MLAQLVPHMRLTEAALHSSPHWVQGIACPAQQTEAGVNQGAFVALAQQPLLQVCGCFLVGWLEGRHAKLCNMRVAKHVRCCTL